ncbi:MAG: EAL domain-containing protein [Cyanobacteria bacterium]|nr:EAL domain-containing protein [Cyanobacteriota bacterium]
MVPELNEQPIIQELRCILGRLETALSAISDALVITDHRGLVLWCNRSFDRFIDQPRMLSLGRPILSLLPLDHQGDPLLAEAVLATVSQIPGSTTVLLQRQPLKVCEMEWRPVDTEVPASVIFCLRDVSTRISNQELQATAERMEQQRQHSDRLNRELQQQQLLLANLVRECPVTGLPNRRGLRERLALALGRLQERGGQIGVLFCDLDHFKDVNDMHGHQVGDDLLIEISRRLQEALPPEATVARLGGDEFVVLTGWIGDGSEAVAIARMLQQRIAAPWLLHGQRFEPTMSVGITVTSDPLADGDELLRQADVAMYHAKRSSAESLALHDASIEAHFRSSCRVHQELRLAILNQKLRLAYQPIVALTGSDLDGSPAILGHEALVRLQPEQGLPIDSEMLIVEAERTGMVLELGSWVISEALRLLQHHPQRPDHWSLAINVSPLQLEQSGFAADLLERIEVMAINPRRLVIEITETKILKDSSCCIQELTSLRNNGVRVHLDDFGTGYSSLSRLARLPIDGIKIDRYFTAALGSDSRLERMIASMIHLGRDLGLEVVAEGIETDSQRLALQALGCLWGQGHLFGRPGDLN